MVATTQARPTWVSLARGRREAGGMSAQAMRRLIAEGQVTCLAIPGTRPKIRLDELRAVVAAHTSRPGT